MSRRQYKYRKLGLRYDFQGVEEQETTNCPQCKQKSQNIENVNPSKYINLTEQIATCSNGHKWDVNDGKSKPVGYCDGYIDQQKNLQSPTIIPHKHSNISISMPDTEITTPITF